MKPPDQRKGPGPKNAGRAGRPYEESTTANPKAQPQILPNADGEIENQFGSLATSETEEQFVREAEERKAERMDMPSIYTPDGGENPIPLVAKAAANVLKSTGRYFIRSGFPVEVGPDGIRNVHPAELVSELQPPICRVLRKTKDGDIPTMFSESRCKSLLHARAFKSALPEIKHLAACPALVPDGSGGLRLVEDFDPTSGVMVRGWDGGPVLDMAPGEAARVLSEVLQDFDFPTEADKARALALLLTPAVLAGQLFGENTRAPVGLIEADASQTGKGYLTRLTGSFYAEKIRTITQRKGGVGSVEEAFSNAIGGGASIILLDNLRGGLDSPLLESATTEPVFECRIPYQAPMPIDVRRVFLLLTSNQARMSKDMANRCCAVRLRKRKPGFIFTRYTEGDVLSHIEANRAKFLGAALSIVRYWWECGKPATDEGRHSFRGWVQPMDWIVQKVFNLPPLLDGHEEAQTRVSDPGLQWLRDIAIAVERDGLTGQALQSSDLLEICIEAEIDVPGSDGSGSDEEQRKMLQGIGRKLAPRFRDRPSVEVDGFTIERTEQESHHHNGKLRRYTFTRRQDDPLLSSIIRYSAIGSNSLKQTECSNSADSGCNVPVGVSETIADIADHSGIEGGQ